MLRFALAPRWLVAHVVVLAIAAVCVSLGFWQLRRHDERQAFNALVTERTRAPERPLEQVLIEHRPDELAYRRTEATGTYDPDHEVLLVGRTHRGRTGHHVLTPLETERGDTVLVDRGWIPYDDPDRRPPALPGTVTVRGILLPSQQAPRFGASAPPPGPVRSVARVDLVLLDERMPHDLAPAYLLLTEQDPPSGELPLPAELPELESGPHVAYAVQWFLFAGVALVVYGAILRQTARKRPA